MFDSEPLSWIPPMSWIPPIEWVSLITAEMMDYFVVSARVEVLSINIVIERADEHLAA